MIVPFSVSDFLDRARTVYGERIGVVDEPDQPAPSLGELTYAELAALRRRQAAQPRPARGRGRRAGRGRLPQQRPAAGRRSSGSRATAGCWSR